ncbi:MAG: metallophosphoesterase [Sulfobacillus acidophilus]|uniref:Metallophosphoesterase n=1 Tax=Sulfobacillus acidophilus TaxID=53633 RepID=A0A2T2WHP1_9FIRM|nr:MAG: metallophosphoesterase [Sulfobacillus acidophilus]
MAVLVALLGYALWEPYRLEAVEHTIRVRNLPPAFENVCILHLSDIHGRVGVFSWPPFLRWLADADLVAVTGDLYSPTRAREPLARALNKIQAPLGVYYVSGNHDYRHGVLAVEPWQPGDRLLDNRVVTIEKDGQQMLLAGLPDLVKGEPRWDEVKAELQRRGLPAILLAHRPDAGLLPDLDGVAVILAGHTHGGQVVIPGYGAVFRHNHLPGRYVAGLWQKPGGPVLITSRGIGTSELPVRFWARPQVIRIRLVRES